MFITVNDRPLNVYTILYYYEREVVTDGVTSYNLYYRITDGRVIEEAFDTEADRTAKEEELAEISAGGSASDLIDDSEAHSDKTYSSNKILELLDAIPKFETQVVQTLPTEDISDSTVYLVPDPDGNDLYVEYIHVNGSWEVIGRQKASFIYDILPNLTIAGFTPHEQPYNGGVLTGTVNDVNEILNAISSHKVIKATMSLPGFNDRTASITFSASTVYSNAVEASDWVVELQAGSCFSYSESDAIISTGTLVVTKDSSFTFEFAYPIVELKAHKVYGINDAENQFDTYPDTEAVKDYVTDKVANGNTKLFEIQLPKSTLEGSSGTISSEDYPKFLPLLQYLYKEGKGEHRLIRLPLVNIYTARDSSGWYDGENSQLFTPEEGYKVLQDSFSINLISMPKIDNVHNYRFSMTIQGTISEGDITSISSVILTKTNIPIASKKYVDDQIAGNSSHLVEIPAAVLQLKPTSTLAEFLESFGGEDAFNTIFSKLLDGYLAYVSSASASEPYAAAVPLLTSVAEDNNMKSLTLSWVEGVYTAGISAVITYENDHASSIEIYEEEASFLTNADALTKDNTTAYTPTSDYHPSTKKYVDDSIAAIPTAEVPTVTITLSQVISQNPFRAQLTQEQIAVLTDMNTPIKFMDGSSISPLLKGYIMINGDLDDQQSGVNQLSFTLDYPQWDTEQGTLVYYAAGLVVLDRTQGYITFSRKELVPKDAMDGYLSNIASEYLSGVTYAVGDLAIHNGILYRCTTAIPTAEEWNSSHWESTTADSEFAKVASVGGLEAHYYARTPYFNSGEQFDNVVQKGINIFQNSKVTINGTGYPLTFDMLFGIKSYAEANEGDILAVFVGEYGMGNGKERRYPTFHYIKKAVSGSYYELDLEQIYLPDILIHTGLDATITGSWAFNNLPESSVTPTTNNQLVNKKYVDDSINWHLNIDWGAPTYGSSSTYEVGDQVTRAGHLYTCTTAISTPEEWNYAHWQLTNLVSEIDKLKPVVVWESNDPANYLKAITTDLSADPAWQLTNLNMTQFKRIKIYTCAGQSTGSTASASTTPAIVLEMILDPRAAISAYDGNYVGSTIIQKSNDANRAATLTCAVSADKTKFVVLRQTNLYGTAATNNNDVNANVFLIEGYYY